jgi:hypothetical protein
MVGRLFSGEQNQPGGALQGVGMGLLCVGWGGVFIRVGVLGFEFRM